MFLTGTTAVRRDIRPVRIRDRSLGDPPSLLTAALALKNGRLKAKASAKMIIRMGA